MDEVSSVHNQLLEKVRGYHMPEAARQLLAAHPPLILAGITASGKNSVTKFLIENSQYRPVITHTTRQPRTGEVNGQDYYFVSDDEMLRQIDNQLMIEVQMIHGDSAYGISLKAYQDIIDAGNKPLLVIDVQGVEEISKYLPHRVRPIFLLPPNFDTWIQWLEKRGHMSHSERLRRMHSARAELEEVLKSDRFLLIVNSEIRRSAAEILSGAHDVSSQHRNRETALLLIDHLKTA